MSASIASALPPSQSPAAANTTYVTEKIANSDW
jgi:hypothetical protein